MKNYSIINMWMYISSLLIASIFVLVNAQEPGQCYYPGRVWANDSRPCDPYAITTLCCPIGWTCFSNYACVVTDLTVVGSTYPLGTTIRGSCTNPLWNDGFCGDFCLNDANNGSLVDCGSGNWCCAADAEDGTCDCSTGNGTFTIPQGVAQTIISVSSLSSTDTAAATSTSEMSTTTSTAGTTLTTTTASSSQITSGTSKTSSTGTSPTSSPTGSAVAKKTPVTSTIGFKAGVSVGGAAMAGILGFLAFWFCCKGKSGRRSTMDFASRSSSAGPVYTPATAAYDTGRAEYGPFNAASVYGSPIPARDPEPYHSSYSAPSPLLRPDADERPVTPEEDYRSNRFPMMATLPREGP